MSTEITNSKMETETASEIKEISVNETPKILRTSDNGCWEVYSGTWGKYLRPTFDPEANAVVTEDHLKHFELNENINRIPADLWAKWVKLCFYYVDKVQSCVEVSTRILRSEKDPSVYRFLIPKQKVSGASVRVDSFDEAIDIDTGEEITQYPPEGWVPVGSSHSHNTMAAFFSGTDDKYELGDPGIHIVVGSINTKDMKYSIAASVVGSGRRFEVDFNSIIDATPVENQQFHKKVLDYVDYSSPITNYSVKGGFVSFNKNTNTSTRNNKSNNKSKSNYNDPKYWGWGDENWDIYNEDYYSDPFYWSGKVDSPKNSSKIDYWNISDSLYDFMNENRNNSTALKQLKTDLYDFLIDLEVLIEDNLVDIS